MKALKILKEYNPKVFAYHVFIDFDERDGDGESCEIDGDGESSEGCCVCSEFYLCFVMYSL